LIASDDHPAREVNDRQTEQPCQRCGDNAGHHEDEVINPRSRWPHGRDDSHSIGFAGDVRHQGLANYLQMWEVQSAATNKIVARPANPDSATARLEQSLLHGKYFQLLPQAASI